MAVLHLLIFGFYNQFHRNISSFTFPKFVYWFEFNLKSQIYMVLEITFCHDV